MALGDDQADVATDGRRVLVVDDDDLIRQLVVGLLHHAGHEVLQASSAEDGMRLLDQERPDLLLLDVELPEMSGFELLLRMKGRIGCPVIMMTGKDAESDRVVGLDLGADDYIVKPFLPREFSARVRAALRRAASQGPVQGAGKGEGRELGIYGIVDAVEIARGGFAVVYQAFQPAFDRPVAVKVLSAGSLDDSATMAFQRECQAIGRLSGRPNILTVYDAGVTSEGAPYLVMAFQAQGSLQDRLDRTGPLPWQEAIGIGVKLARALDAAHGAGILHRDLKPANVLLSDDGEPSLADFGIAHVGKATVLSGLPRAFTPTFASPEMWAGSAVTGATDIYSLGATLYALMTGRPPFVDGPNESVVALIARVATAPPPELPDGVPEPVKEAIKWAMARDPDERPPSAAAFATVLETLRGTGTTSDGPGTLPDSLPGSLPGPMPESGPDDSESDAAPAPDPDLSGPKRRRRWGRQE